MKDPSILPFAYRPGTPEFRSLLRDTTRGELRDKFGRLEQLSPKALRSEVGSAARLVEACFRSQAVALRCRDSGFLGPFLRTPGARLIVEAGDATDEVTRLVMGGILTRMREVAERRPAPYPPIEAVVDECNNKGRLIGKREERALAEMRKFRPDV